MCLNSRSRDQGSPKSARMTLSLSLLLSQNLINPYLPKFANKNKVSGRVAFIGIVNRNHFVLPMSLFIDLTFRLPNREASLEQFLAVLPLQ